MRDIVLKLHDLDELIALTDRDAILTKLQQFSAEELRTAFCMVLLNWNKENKDYEDTITRLEQRFVEIETK